MAARQARHLMPSLMGRLLQPPARRIIPFLRPAWDSWQPPYLPARFAHAIPRPPQPSSMTEPAATISETRGTIAGEHHKGRYSSNSRGADELGKLESRPYYKLEFTCIPCGQRSSHDVSKQGYHHGSVLITCPSCHNRHVMSDHLGIFGDRKVTVEDILREKGQLVKRASLGKDGDIEFWADDRAQPDVEHDTESSNAAEK